MQVKLQSAMEYLMTYGWAILIIAVVLGALFQLGIFNASTFTPKAPPGACHVFRPNGPLSTSFINLQGICNGELPQYAAYFNGVNSYIDVGTSGGLNIQNAITLSAWISPKSSGIGTIVAKNAPYYLAFGNSQLSKTACVGGGIYSSAAWHWVCGNTKIPINAWSHIVIVYDQVTETAWFDGVNDGSISLSGAMPSFSDTVKIGYGTPGYNQYFNGYISDVQIYNTSLSSNEVSALYNEGIGGAPIKLNSLVGWWPLNGDVKDYSGNGNNGVPTGVTFTSNWESGYSAP